MKNKLKRFFPLGMEMKFEKQFFITGLILSFIYSLLFLIRFSDWLSFLYETVGGKRVLREGAIMEDFHILLESALFGFIILALCMAIFIILHYSYHKQGSKSIYLMKRLPNKWELHKRCLTLPLIAIAICFVTAIILLFIYYGIYMAFTPKECLQPDQLSKLWRAIL